jgi:hypothetical protein
MARFEISRRFALLATLTLSAALAAPAQSRDEPPESRVKLARAEPNPDGEEPASGTAPAATATSPEVAHEIPVYQPPRRGAPRRKVGGGMRGARAVPEPLTLAPEHVARTASPQPSLFWFVDSVPAGELRVVFTLIEAEGEEPLVEATLETPSRAGIQRIRLADYGVALRPGVEYEWSIAFVVDPDHRARDLVATASIERVTEPAFLEADGATARYAAAGLWYDALESISDAIRNQPADARLQRQRDVLLRQVGLEAASKGE